jgi:hypothetical protein
VTITWIRQALEELIEVIRVGGVKGRCAEGDDLARRPL